MTLTASSWRTAATAAACPSVPSVSSSPVLLQCVRRCMPPHGELLDPSVAMLPAGLGEIFDLRDKAVVIACMHVFCLACLARWSALKKSCPLCKVTSLVPSPMHAPALRLGAMLLARLLPSGLVQYGSMCEQHSGH